MSEFVSTTVEWVPVLEKLERILLGGRVPHEEVLGLKDQIYEIGVQANNGRSCSNAQMWKLVPAEVKELAQKHFIASLALGYATRVYELLWYVGPALGVYERKHPQSTPDYLVERFASEAIAIAKASRQFGTACALAELCGEFNHADTLREEARGSHQKVVLDYTCSLL